MCATELAEASAEERKAAGDKRSHDFLMEALAAERPDDAVLSEEGADDPVRLTAERVWIVDPLDGTREFSELGRDGLGGARRAVAVARRTGGRRGRPSGARHYAGHARPSRRHRLPRASPRIVVSRTRPPAIALAVRDALDGTLVEMGSAGAKVASVVQGHLRHLRARGRPVRMGLGGAGRGGARRRTAHVAHRRLAAGSTTSPTRCCPISWCAVRSSRTRCWPSPRARSADARSTSGRIGVARRGLSA